MKSRILCLALALTMLLTFSSFALAEDEPYEADILCITFTGEPIADDAPTKLAFEELTNSLINFTWVADSNYEEKLNVMMASQSLPTIVVLKGLTSSVIENARYGAFWDLTDYIDDYEYLSQINPVIINNVSIDGRLYGIPRTRVLGRMGITYRKDWLANLGMEEPTTVDELYDVLYAFTYNDPDGNGENDTYGMTWCKYDGPLDIITTWFNGGNQWVEQEDGSVIPYFETDGYWEAMQWAKKLYDDGLVNEDFAVRDSAIWTDDFKASRSGVFVDCADAAQRMDSSLVEQGIEDAVWVIGTVAGPDGNLYNLPTAGHAGIVAITKAGAKTEEDLRAALEFLDSTNTTEAMNMFTYGLPGRDFTIDDEGYVVRTEGATDTINQENEGFNQFMTNVANTATQEKRSTIREQVYQVQYVINPDLCVANPCQSLLSSSTVYSEKGSTLETIVDDARVQYIVGQLDEEGYKAEIQRWYDQGGADLVAELSEMNQATK
ncbi:MAG TPA: extracellular solute-binding protein [Candidatus Limiplasma sp.]|nr:extracellular solute-binding protein [Candidatus Limiplasma sp.]